MPLTLAESQAINQMASLLYDFLPGTPHPYSTAQHISFPGVAHDLDLSQYWIGGSKLPALTRLLEQTLANQRNKFCPLVEEIVRRGTTYRLKKSPVMREEVEQLNKLLLQVKFKIPNLWDPNFLDSLPTQHRRQPDPSESKHTDPKTLLTLKNELSNLETLSGSSRGYAFEKFLQALFTSFDLKPRKPFKLVGEQIDGSFQLGTDTYLVEAKWHQEPRPQRELLAFAGVVGGKAEWSRGIFISYSGFTPDGLIAFSRGRPTNLIGMDGSDLYFILDEEITLVEAIIQKTRRAAETGEFFVPIYQLIREGS